MLLRHTAHRLVCSQVWQFDLRDVQFLLNKGPTKGEPVEIGKLRVVCMEKGEHLAALDQLEAEGEE